MDPVRTFPPELRVRLATPADRMPLYRMLELYQYELSDIWDQDLDPNGEYGYSLDRYWQDPHCSPYLILAGNAFAGFALVDKAVRVPGDDFWMDQFFVMKKYRRLGFGRAAAGEVFALHPGQWQVGQMAGNLPAQAFWRRTIANYTSGQYREEQVTSGGWHGRVQRFRSAGKIVA